MLFDRSWFTFSEYKQNTRSKNIVEYKKAISHFTIMNPENKTDKTEKIS